MHTLIEALLNYDEEDAFDLVRQMRSCDDLEEVAQSINSQQKGPGPGAGTETEAASDGNPSEVDRFELELSGRMSELLLDGSRRFIGGTSNLIFLPADSDVHDAPDAADANPNAVKSWTQVTDNDSLISHLLTMYFTWHYPFFTILSKDLFYRDYMSGTPSVYCSALLVNAMLALGCHFSSWTGAYTDPQDVATAGNHFFKEAKRLIHQNDEHENAKLCTVQAFALMSVREAGCGREGKGWVYSGLSFRMALDLGLNIDAKNTGRRALSDEELDARRITFWGCYLIDKSVSSFESLFLNSNIWQMLVKLSWSPTSTISIAHQRSKIRRLPQRRNRDMVSIYRFRSQPGACTAFSNEGSCHADFKAMRDQ